MEKFASLLACGERSEFSSDHTERKLEHNVPFTFFQAEHAPYEEADRPPMVAKIQAAEGVLDEVLVDDCGSVLLRRVDLKQLGTQRHIRAYLP